MIQLGQKVKDKITGFTGIVIGRAEYLTGCNQFGVQPEVGKDGKVEGATWFDEGRLQKIGVGITAKQVSADKNGGPRNDHPTK